MVDNKSKTSLIRHIREKSLLKINYIIFVLGTLIILLSLFVIHVIGEVFLLQVPRSVMPMGNVTKYLQKLGMGVYDNKNQQGVSKKINRI